MGRVLLILATIAAALVAFSPGRGAGDPGAASESFFELKVRPVLAGTCVKCHGDEEGQRRPAARLARGDARGRRGRAGGRAGRPGAQPADPGGPATPTSRSRCRRTSRCPRRSQDDLAAWVAAGATWPKAELAAQPIAGQTHWAFEPLRPIAPPADPTGWAAQPIDRFIAAGHRAKGLQPVRGGRPADADPPGVPST